MRIALVYPYSFTRPGGVKRHILGLYREFKKQNLYVKILTPRAQTPFLKDVIFLSRSVRLPSNVASFDVSLNLPKVSESIKEVLAKNNFDIIHFHEPVNPFLSWQLLRASGRQTPSKAINIGTFHSAWQGGLSLNIYRASIKPFEDFSSVDLMEPLLFHLLLGIPGKSFWKRKMG